MGGSESESGADANDVNQLPSQFDDSLHLQSRHEPSSALNPQSQESIKKKKKKKKKKSKKKESNDQTDSPSVPVTRVTQQTDPPSIPVLDLFPTGEFPEGEIQQYKDEWYEDPEDVEEGENGRR